MKLLVHLHLYYHNQIDYFIEKLSNIEGCDWDLYVTYVEENPKTFEKIKNLKPETKFFKVKNIGYDIWPFIQIIRQVELKNYDYVIKLHTKAKSKQNIEIGDLPAISGFFWRDELVNSILHSKMHFKNILKIIDKNKNIGFVSSKFFYIPIGNILPEDNEMLWDLKEKLGIKSNLNYFLAGTMFMIKSNLLEIIKKSEIKEDDFPQKSASNGNSTIAHTIERIFAMICDMNKNEIYLIKTNKYYWKYLQIYFENTIKEIFSIRNSDDKKHKILTILGIKISFNR